MRGGPTGQSMIDLHYWTTAKSVNTEPASAYGAAIAELRVSASLS
jgi:hypothetical protein